MFNLWSDDLTFCVPLWSWNFLLFGLVGSFFLVFAWWGSHRFDWSSRWCWPLWYTLHLLRFSFQALIGVTELGFWSCDGLLTCHCSRFFTCLQCTSCLILLLFQVFFFYLPSVWFWLWFISLMMANFFLLLLLCSLLWLFLFFLQFLKSRFLFINIFQIFSLFLFFWFHRRHRSFSTNWFKTFIALLLVNAFLWSIQTSLHWFTW